VQSASKSDVLEGLPTANETVEESLHETQPAIPVDVVPKPRDQPRSLGKLGRFELKELLGQGAYGRVYRAYDPQLDREVALKVPIFGPDDKHKIQRFSAEAKAAARLRHPNIVSTYESGQIGAQYYIAAQFVSGQTLAQRLAQGRPDFRLSAEWIRQLALALAYAHEAGIVHRDIKPENMILDDSGVPHIMDFGLAKRINDDAAMTTDGSILGTPAYMSPEQARGDLANVGPKSDQYSLGVVFYQLLTGKKPFEGSPHSVIAKVVAAEPPPPRSLDSKIPEDLEAICEIAMNKNAAERYPSCSEFSADVARWLGGYETDARPLTAVERGWRWYRRNALVAGLLTAVAVLLIAMLGTTGTLFWFFAASRNRDSLPTATTDASVIVKPAVSAAAQLYEEGEQLRLGLNGVAANDAEAVQRYRSAAEDGHAGAQFRLGDLYATGRGVEKDELEAVMWFRKAAELGDPQAQNALGGMYANGRGVAKNGVAAVKWYRKAAEQGLASAQFNLAVMYGTGQGVSKDEAEAANWYRNAAEQGNVGAQFRLGEMYANGRGIKNDDAQAAIWFRRAAEQNHAAAQDWIGYLYQNGRGVERDDAKAVDWFRKAAEQGNANGQHNLGFMYENGRGVKTDFQEALRLYRLAAEQGDRDGQRLLAAMYERGRGVPKDEAEAAKWNAKANAQAKKAAAKK